MQHWRANLHGAIALSKCVCFVYIATGWSSAQTLACATVRTFRNLENSQDYQALVGWCAFELAACKLLQFRVSNNAEQGEQQRSFTQQSARTWKEHCWLRSSLLFLTLYRNLLFLQFCAAKTVRMWTDAKARRPRSIFSSLVWMHRWIKQSGFCRNR